MYAKDVSEAFVTQAQSQYYVTLRIYPFAFLVPPSVSNHGHALLSGRGRSIARGAKEFVTYPTSPGDHCQVSTNTAPVAASAAARPPECPRPLSVATQTPLVAANKAFALMCSLSEFCLDAFTIKMPQLRSVLRHP